LRDPVSFDPTSLAAGIAVAILGVYALLESEGTVDLSLGWAAVAVTAALGALFVLSGVSPGGEDRHDCQK
jgi:hypothetical protein